MSLLKNSLWNGKYINVKTFLDHPYEMIVSNTQPVCILPYYLKRNGFETEPVFIVRQEWCPPYFDKNGEGVLSWTLITGGIEEGEEPFAAAKRELREEAGIYDTAIHIVKHDKVNIWKNTTDVLNFYLVELVSFSQEEPKGDGTENEKRSRSVQVSLEELKEITNGDLIFNYGRMLSFLHLT